MLSASLAVLTAALNWILATVLALWKTRKCNTWFPSSPKLDININPEIDWEKDYIDRHTFPFQPPCSSPHSSAEPGEPSTHPGMLGPRDTTYIQMTATRFGSWGMLQAMVKSGQGNALFREAVSYHLPCSFLSTLPRQLYWKPEFAHFMWVNTPNTTGNYLKVADSWFGSCLHRIACPKPQIASPIEITFSSHCSI